MAVAFSATVTGTAANGTSFGPTAISVAAGNPVVIVHLCINASTDLVTGVSSSVNGAFTKVSGVILNGTKLSQAQVWVLKAPTVGGMNISGTFSSAVNYQFAIITYTGADQTDPCPSGDAVTSTTASTSVTVTPLHLGANDAAAGVGASTAGNPTSVTPNQRWQDATTAINAQAGDATGTTGVTFNYDGAADNQAMVAVRIKEPGAAAGIQVIGAVEAHVL